VLAADTNDPHVKKIVEEHLGKATFQLADAKQSYADWHRGWRQMIIQELERNRVLREDRITWRRDLSEALTEARQQLVRWMLAFNTADAFAGVDPQQETGLIEDLDPDDGGFTSHLSTDFATAD
jgi:hypothetical protein